MTRATATLHRPGTVGEAMRMLAEFGDAELLAGGTDLVPALRVGDRRPRAIVALRRVLELRARGADARALTIGAGVTYTELAQWAPAPGLVAVARAVGSPQIRNAGTVGGALGSANPRGDLLTFLTAAGAEVLTCSVRRGPRTLALADYLATARRRRELVTAVRVPAPRGPQVFLKLGGRQAAYPPQVSCALVVDRPAGRVGCAFGGIAGSPTRAAAAEEFAQAEIDLSAPPRGTAADTAARRFGELVALAAREVGDPLPVGPRETLEYRWHAVGVLASRAMARALAAGPDAGPPGQREPVGQGQAGNGTGMS